MCFSITNDKYKIFITTNTKDWIFSFWKTYPKFIDVIYLDNCPTSISKIGLFKFASSSKSTDEDAEGFPCNSFLVSSVPSFFTLLLNAGLKIRTIPVNEPVIIKLEFVPVKCLNGWMAKLFDEYSSSGPAPES